MDALKRLLLLVLMLLPAVASACPNCVGSQDRNTTLLKVIGAFMLVPFIVCYLVIRVIRRAERDIVEKLVRPIGLLLLAHAASAAVVADDARGYSFELPPGYEKSELAPGVYARGRPGEDATCVLRVEPLGGTIGREPLIRATVEAATRRSLEGSGIEATAFDYRTIGWQQLELPMVATQMRDHERRFSALSLQVPLAKGAIQLVLMGPSEVQLTANLKAVLGSLKGRSNWLSDDERDQRLGMGVGIAMVGVVGGLISLWLWRRRRRS